MVVKLFSQTLRHYQSWPGMDEHSSDRTVSWHCDGFVVCGDRYHVVPYWPWFRHWWSVRSTTAIQFSWCVWWPPKTVAVCIECCRTAGVLSQEVRTHHSVTPWTPLVESSGEDKVSALCSGFPMSSWYSATVPRRDSAFDNQPQFLQSPTAVYLIYAVTPRRRDNRSLPRHAE